MNHTLQSTFRLVAVLVTLALAAVFAPAQVVPDAASDEETVEAGRKSFATMCGACHGENATGGRGSDLTTGNWKWGGSDTEIILNIRKGIPGTQMPPFAVSDDEAAEIVAYLRTLSSEKQEPITGDPAAGRKLFFGSAGCINCHFFGGAGGRLGPDLTKIRDEKSVGDLRTAITNPSESLRPSFETVEVEFADGRIIQGAKKSEDTFSVQFLDTNEKLQLHSKSKLKRVSKVHESLMPAAKLEASQVEDVIAFLMKGEAPKTAAEWKPSPDLNVTTERLYNADSEPHNWLTYWGNLRGTHYSRLDQINRNNVASLNNEWSFQFGGGTVETTPLIVDGVMFVTGPLNDAAALDARTGSVIWRYRHKVPDDVHAYCTVMTNRGFAILGDRLYLATLDTRLLALDAKTGNVIWDVAVDDYTKGYSITLAPLAVDGKVFVGVTSGECGLNGWVDAFDAATGEKLWRFWAVPREGEPGRETWAGNSGDFGGAPTWLTGSYDVETKTLYWTTGNPAPDYDGTVREGDNLYSDSVLALDAETGRLKWHFQHTPHDTHDWDSNQAAVILDADFKGKPRKLLIQANRNGFYYVLDRITGEFLLGRAFIYQDWADGLDSKGRPILIPNKDPTEAGVRTCPDAWGGTNWAAPSYSPETELYYVAIREACAMYTSKFKEPIAGRPYTGTGYTFADTDPQGGAIGALDPLTGDYRWRFNLLQGMPVSGVLATAGGVVFGGTAFGHLLALDAATGELLWRQQLGAPIKSAPISYAVAGKQYITLAADAVLYTFALPSSVGP